MSSPLLEVKGLKTDFNHGRKRWRTAVSDVSLQLRRGEMVGLVGESGCGKSVLSLSIMRLLEKKTSRVSGEILFEGKDLLKLGEKQMRAVRSNDISMIFQEPVNALDPVMRIEDQLSEVIAEHNHIDRAEARGRAIAALESVRISAPETVCRSYPHELSAGVCQRIMIAMAMACEPKVLIADEPTTKLDVTIQAQILALMEQIRQERATAILLITHDLGVVAETCSRMVVMYAGSVVEQGSVMDVFKHPDHPYTQGLIASVPRLGTRARRLFVIPGNPPGPGRASGGCRFAPRCPYVQERCRAALPELRAISPDHLSRCRIAEEERTEVRAHA